jgi:predicted transglutaminase-like cysteine proteinase
MLAPYLKETLVRPVLILLVVAVVLFAAVLLTSCATEPTPIRGTGQAVDPPGGWIEFCQRHADDPSCQVKR